MNRHITVRPMSAERRAALLAAPQPKPEQRTKFADRTDKQILGLDLDPTLSRDDSIAVTAEMLRRGLYGN